MSTTATASTAIQHHATLIKNAGGFLAHTLKSTLSDKQEWSPSFGEECTGRCALDQISECIGLNFMVASLLNGTPPSGDGHGEGRPFKTAEEAQRMLIESSAALGDAIANCNEEKLAQEYEVPFGKFTGWFLAEITLANMHYHAGQINYIQLLYGDKEFHFPE